MQDDTIVALATPPGIGAIGVIRLSGAEAIAICNRLFPAKDLLLPASHTLHVGTLQEGSTVIDEVVLSLYKAPRSYTGENIVEISCHGSPYILDQVIQLCIQQGARLAKPGEFTQRAFLNGKLDLTQAEAVADLIASNSLASHQTAMRNMRGGFTHVLQALREQLIRFSALIELELDFSQEDVEFANRVQLYGLVKEASKTVDGLVQSFRLGNVIKNGVNVVIAGKPNAGKSTLLNTLLNEDRALVSEIAGTTRDTVEEVINIRGILFRLIDTAGLREHTGDRIESAGMEKTLEKIRDAHIVVYLFDVMECTREEIEKQQLAFEKQGTNYLLTGNKTDLTGAAAAVEKFYGMKEMRFISAKDPALTELLKSALADKVLKGELQTENTIVTNARHHAALTEVQKSLDDVRKGLDDHIPEDLLSLDIRRCLYYIGEITGEVTNEDRLDYIFSKFCIGK